MTLKLIVTFCFFKDIQESAMPMQKHQSYVITWYQLSYVMHELRPVHSMASS